MEFKADGLFAIPESNMAKFEAAIAKLSKKSTKLTGEPITPIVFGFDMIPNKAGFLIKYYNVLLGGDAPIINGWEFVATIDHTYSEVGNVIRTVNGKAFPDKYRSIGCSCDHCSTVRRRNSTFLLQHENTKEFKQNSL